MYYEIDVVGVKSHVGRAAGGWAMPLRSSAKVTLIHKLDIPEPSPR